MREEGHFGGAHPEQTGSRSLAPERGKVASRSRAPNGKRNSKDSSWNQVTDPAMYQKGDTACPQAG